MKKNFLSRIRGFSLIELLISLMIISVITAAFAPIISKKINKGSMGVSANKVKTDCPEDKYGTNCQMCDSNKCLFKLCTNTCAGNQYRDDSNCACVNCSTFGDDCLSCDSSGCLATKSAAGCPKNCATCDEYGKCATCSDNAKLKNGDCIFYKTPKNQEDCDKATNYNSIYIPNNLDNPDAGGFCVHRKNAGDYGGPSTDSPYITTVGASTKAADACKSAFCCWVGGEGRSDIEQICTVPSKTSTATNSLGKTVTTCGCSVYSGTTCTTYGYCTRKNDADDLAHIEGVGEGTYGACNRTVCNWDAAAYICQKYSVGTTESGDWGLPNETQLKAIKAAIDAGPANKTSTTHKIAIQKFSGSNGLQLCAHSGTPKTTGTPKCNQRTDSCLKDDKKNPCRPNYIWGSMGESSSCSTVYISGGKSELSCTGYVCVKYSTKCDVQCDKAKYGTAAWQTSPVKDYTNKDCNKTKWSCPSTYPYENSREKPCISWEESSGNVTAMYLKGNDTDKTTDVTIETTYAYATAKFNNASVRCVLNRYVE